MHNGCLLLLAFVAVLQPIASYTERGLVDGRQQRSDYRTSHRDPGAHLHGTYRFTKPTVEEPRLSTREDIREARRNEIRGETLRTTSSDRRLVDTLERNRNVLTRPSRDRGSNEAILRRENRDTRLVANHRDERNQETRLERASTRKEIQFNRQDSRLFGNDNRHQSSIDNTRVSVESRRDTRRNGNNAQAQRAKESRETRVASKGAWEDVARRLTEHRAAREEAERMDTRRSVSGIQFNRNVDREVLGQRTRNSDYRSSSISTDRVNRAFNNEDSRFATREDNRSLDRERRTVSRRSVDQIRQLRDISRIQRQSRTDEQRNIRDSAYRSLHERTSENRRDAQTISQPQSTERNSRIRAVPSLEDSRIQNVRSNLKTSERARSVENRIDSNEARRMNEIRSQERKAETRMESRSRDRARLSESRNEIRKVERESKTIANNRAAANLRDTHHVERIQRTDRVQEESCNKNRDTCTFDRVRSTERRNAGMLINKRNSRNVERESRIRGIDRLNQRDNQIHSRIRSVNRQQSEETRREARDVHSEVFRAEQSRRVFRNVDRTFRTERTDERSARIVENLRDSRAVRSERSDKNQRDSVETRALRTTRSVETRRDSRNLDARTASKERSNESRRDIRSIDSQAFRMERTDGNRREARTADSRALRTERTVHNGCEVRDFERQTKSLDRDQYRRDRQNSERDARLQDRTIESRRKIRNTETRSRTENYRVIGNRRTRSLEREVRSFGRERSIESARMISRDSRTFVPERRERDTENRGNVGSIRTKSRSSDSQESRRVESRVNNLVRSRDDSTERLSKRDSLNSRRDYKLHRESRRETRRTSERDNLITRNMYAQTRNSNTEFAEKREVPSIFQSPKQSNEVSTMNWQYLFYTLQGLYICGVLMQLMGEWSVEKKTRASWWPVRQHLIKVD